MSRLYQGWREIRSSGIVALILGWFLQLGQFALHLEKAANENEDVSEMNAPGKNVRRVQMLETANCVH